MSEMCDSEEETFFSEDEEIVVCEPESIKSNSTTDKGLISREKIVKLSSVLTDKKEKENFLQLAREGFRTKPEGIDLENYTENQHFNHGFYSLSYNIRSYLCNTTHASVKIPFSFPYHMLLSQFKRENIDHSILSEIVSGPGAFIDSEGIDQGMLQRAISSQYKDELYGKCSKLNELVFGPFLEHLKDKFEGIEIKEGTEHSFIKTYLNLYQDLFFRKFRDELKKKKIIVDFMHPTEEFLIRITDTVTKDAYLDIFSEISEKLIGSRVNFIINNNNCHYYEELIKAKEEKKKDSSENPTCGVEYSVMKKNFEKNHCKIIDKSFFIKISDNGYQIISAKGLVTSYQHWSCFTTVPGKKDKKEVKKTVQFIKNWTLDPYMRCYESIDCYPDAQNCPKNVYNTWTPFVMEKVKEYTNKKEELNIILNHIRILTGNEEAIFNHFCLFIGHMITRPWEKSICPSILSKEGTGKSWLVLLLSKMFGEQKVFQCDTPERDVWGTFNPRMATAFLVVLSEINKSNSMGAEGKIKALTTDSTIVISNKGKDAIEQKSSHRFMVITNNLDPVRTSKDDRRNFIIRASDEKIGDQEYFTILFKLLEDVNVIKTCYEYFKTLPDTCSFKEMKIPRTEHQEELIEANEPAIEMWLKEFVNSEQEVHVLKASQTLSLFDDFLRANGMTFKITSQNLMLKIGQMKIPGVTKGSRDNNMRTTIFNKREMRKHFGMTPTIFYESDDDD